MTASLQEALERPGSPVGLLRNLPARPHVFPVTAEHARESYRVAQLRGPAT